MERIYLTKIEKKIFRAIDHNSINTDLLKSLTKSQIIAALNSLKNRGFVECRINYGEVLDEKLTHDGQAYKDEFKTLRNKITDTNKWFIAIIISVITSIISIIISLLHK